MRRGAWKGTSERLETASSVLFKMASTISHLVDDANLKT